MNRRRKRLSIVCATIALATTAMAGAKPSSVALPKPATRPNVLIIVADDLGYSDLGAFGGEIETPHLDALARRGVRLTQFYTAPTCSPTRAMLLTGRDSHEVGLGTMAEFVLPGQEGKEGYEGALNRRAATLAERLAEAGYHTMMAGKWHLGIREDQSPAARGFQRSFALLRGGHNHFGVDQDGAYKAAGAESLYREDGRLARYPLGVYSADYFAGRLIEYLKASPDDGRPFFAYLTFTQPHLPLQAPAETIAKYKGRYDRGPAALRAERLDRMKALGIISPATAAYPENLADWASLPPEQRAIEARKMEVYAAMIDRMDQNVGRVVEVLRELSKLDNTIIIFLSDNGAAGSVADFPISMRNPGQKIDTPYDNSLANMGAASSALTHGLDWPHAATAPYRGLKAATTEGGIRTPAFVAGPGIRGGGVTNGPLHVLDIFPTVLDLAKVSAAGGGDGSVLTPMGRSWAPMLAGKTQAVREAEAELNWELFYQRAARRGRWKAVYLAPRLRPGESLPPVSWELYDVVSDPGETKNLAGERPAVLQRLIAQWEAYARRVGVVPPPGDAPSAKLSRKSRYPSRTVTWLQLFQRLRPQMVQN